MDNKNFHLSILTNINSSIHKKNILKPIIQCLQKLLIDNPVYKRLQYSIKSLENQNNIFCSLLYRL